MVIDGDRSMKHAAVAVHGRMVSVQQGVPGQLRRDEGPGRYAARGIVFAQLGLRCSPRSLNRHAAARRARACALAAIDSLFSQRFRPPMFARRDFICCARCRKWPPRLKKMAGARLLPKNPPTPNRRRQRWHPRCTSGSHRPRSTSCSEVIRQQWRILTCFASTWPFFVSSCSPSD
jgi:hypothetical protein